MGIWNYDDLAHPFDTGFTAHILDRHTCLYCKSLLQELNGVLPSSEREIDSTEGWCCPICGWWYVLEVYEGNHDHYFGGFSRLKNLDINNIETPIDEVRQYLLAKYSSRFDIHPQLFEETVAAIFRLAGYETRVTAYTGDNGIDIYLDGPDDALIGVQVKRWRSSIKVEQIHSLAGALIINGCTGGVFVTTSEFQRGARSNAERFQAVAGIPITLMNFEQLYDALRITGRSHVQEGSDPTAPWNKIVRPALWTQL